MSDLISRSAVVDIIYKAINKTTDFLQHDTQLDILYEVEELQIAYDVEKVVEELEAVEKLYIENCIGEYDMGVYCGIKDVIEIVRNGGVEPELQEPESKPTWKQAFLRTFLGRN